MGFGNAKDFGRNGTYLISSTLSNSSLFNQHIIYWGLNSNVYNINMVFSIRLNVVFKLIIVNDLYTSTLAYRKISPLMDKITSYLPDHIF